MHDSQEFMILMHDSQEFMVKNLQTQKAQPEEKGVYLVPLAPRTTR